MNDFYNNVSADFLEDRFLPCNNYIQKGDDIQKFSVLETLPQLLENDPKSTINRLIPKILQELPTSSCEFNVTCSKVFRSLIEQRVTLNLLSAVLQGIECWDPIVANSWMETLIVVIPFLNEVQIKAEIIPLAHNKALLTMPSSARIASCRILGQLAVHKSIHPNEVKRDMLPLVQSLCQDCNPDVRAVICMQLPNIAQGLAHDPSKESLMVCLVELASDNVAYVKGTAVSVIVQMFPHTTADTMKNAVLPLVIQVCGTVLTTDDASVINVSKEYGKLAEGLKSYMSHSECIWFLNSYKALAHRGLASGPYQFRSTDVTSNVMCRENSAANLPLMAKFVLTTLLGQTDILNSIVHDLASDPCYLVRQTVANCFSDVTSAFGIQCKGLKQDFVRLLRDDSEEVLEKITRNISTTLQVFCNFSIITPDIINPNSADIGRALLKCYFDIANGFNWRLLACILNQFECLPNNLPADYIHQHFTPVVLTCAIQGKGKPVRTQACRTLLVFLRYNKKEMQRRWLRENLISQLCNSPSSYTRLIYIRMCQNALEIFSERYFKQYFLENLLSLANDPVVNVRLCVVNMLAILKYMLVLPHDQHFYDKVEETFLKCRTDEKDKDVVAAYHKQLKYLGNIRSIIDKDAHAKEQQRLQEEEDELYEVKNSGNGQQNTTRRNMPFKKSLKESSSQESNARAHSQNRFSTNTAVDPTNRTMPFLEQNFYIDAGVSLTETMSKHANVEDEFQLLNITDDDKVTLRNATKNKRYSSILSTTCLEKNQKTLNRRSLNIQTRSASKIPISSIYNKTEATNNKNINKCNDSSNSHNLVALESNGHKISSSTPSHLPILQRRTRSEIRKT